MPRSHAPAWECRFKRTLVHTYSNPHKIVYLINRICVGKSLKILTGIVFFQYSSPPMRSNPPPATSKISAEKTGHQPLATAHLSKFIPSPSPQHRLGDCHPALAENSAENQLDPNPTTAPQKISAENSTHPNQTPTDYIAQMAKKVLNAVIPTAEAAETFAPQTFINDLKDAGQSTKMRAVYALPPLHAARLDADHIKTLGLNTVFLSQSEVEQLIQNAITDIRQSEPNLLKDINLEALAQFELAKISAESNYAPFAVSSANAQGLAQLMPFNSTNINAFNPQSNVTEGLRLFLGDKLPAFDGDLQEAIAAYNWGPSKVQRVKTQHGNKWQQYIPKETKGYLKRIAKKSTEIFGDKSLLATALNQNSLNVASTQSLNASVLPTIVPTSPEDPTRFMHVEWDGNGGGVVTIYREMYQPPECSGCDFQFVNLTSGHLGSKAWNHTLNVQEREYLSQFGVRPNAYPFKAEESQLVIDGTRDVAIRYQLEQISAEKNGDTPPDGMELHFDENGEVEMENKLITYWWYRNIG